LRIKEHDSLHLLCDALLLSFCSLHASTERLVRLTRYDVNHHLPIVIVSCLATAIKRRFDRVLCPVIQTVDVLVASDVVKRSLRTRTWLKEQIQMISCTLFYPKVAVGDNSVDFLFDLGTDGKVVVDKLSKVVRHLILVLLFVLDAECEVEVGEVTVD